jgi:hypothetical protein
VASYTTDAEDDLLWGKSNLDAWADIDNKKDQITVDARRTWAQETAYAQINARLRDGLYTIPITGTIPDEIKYISSLRVGILLYDSRRIALQNDSKDAVLPHRRMYEMELSEILSGKKKLDLTLLSKNYPVSIDVESAE